MREDTEQKIRYFGVLLIALLIGLILGFTINSKSLSDKIIYNCNEFICQEYPLSCGKFNYSLGTPKEYMKYNLS